ncbi:MAG TPA: lipocalin-like domain-containing protein [Holophagaceae bacterium]|nr:lipocalin-like domain-containing protein [Holophagaceae bacterium]
MRRLLPFAFVLLALAPAAAQTPAQGATALVGTWRLLRVDNVQADGTRIPLYGEHPEGRLMVDAQGRYSLQILRAQRPRFASGDKAKGTEAEHRAAVQGNNSHFGAFSVDDTAHTLTFRIEHAFFPNWEGTTQVRPYTLEGEELSYTVPAPTTGGVVTGEVRWRRER